MMPKPKTAIGAKHSPNEDRYCMTLIEVESFKRRQLSHSLLHNRLCGGLGVTVGKGYPTSRQAKFEGFVGKSAEVGNSRLLSQFWVVLWFAG